MLISLLNRLLEGVYFHGDSRIILSAADSLSVGDNSLRKDFVGFLERKETILDAVLEHLLLTLQLNMLHLTPVLTVLTIDSAHNRNRLIGHPLHQSAKPHHHSGFVSKREFINGPGDAAHLCVYLDEDFVDD